MLFKPDLCQLILLGLKTQTRRLVLPGDLEEREDDGAIYCVTRPTMRGRRTKWLRYDCYAVQPGRGKKAAGYVRLTGIRQERLQEISPEDAMAEGVLRLGNIYVASGRPAFPSPCAAFADLWDSINRKKGTRWHDNPPVWVLTFEEAP